MTLAWQQLPIPPLSRTVAEVWQADMTAPYLRYIGLGAATIRRYTDGEVWLTRRNDCEDERFATVDAAKAAVEAENAEAATRPPATVRGVASTILCAAELDERLYSDEAVAMRAFDRATRGISPIDPVSPAIRGEIEDAWRRVWST